MIGASQNRRTREDLMKTNTSKHIVRLIIFIMTIASLSFSSFAASSSDISKIPDSTTPEATHNLTDCVIGGADFDLVTPEDVTGKSAESKRKFLSGKSTSQMRELPLLVICIGFNDIKYIDEYDWGDKIFSDSDYSVRKFYKDNSMGKFTFVPARETSQYGVDGNTNVNDKANDGVVHINLDTDHERWDSGGLNSNIQSFWIALGDALKEADKYVDFSKNNITARAIAEACEKAEKPTLLTRDTIDIILSSNLEPLLMNEQLCYFAPLPSLQKLFRAVYYPKVILLSQPLMQIAEALHKFTLSYPASIITLHNGQILVAKNGNVSAVPIEKTTYTPLTLWMGEAASKIAVFNLYNPNQFENATISALF